MDDLKLAGSNLERTVCCFLSLFLCINQEACSFVSGVIGSSGVVEAIRHGATRRFISLRSAPSGGGFVLVSTFVMTVYLTLLARDASAFISGRPHENRV